MQIVAPRLKRFFLKFGARIRKSLANYLITRVLGVFPDRFHDLLVAVQIALGGWVGAGLLVRNLVGLGRVNPGFRRDRVLVARLSRPDNRYPHTPQLTALMDRFLEKIDSITGVLNGLLLFAFDVRSCWSAVFVIEERPIPRTEDPLNARFNGIEPGYLKTMGIPLVQGRDFTQRDGPVSPMVFLGERSLCPKTLPLRRPSRQAHQAGFSGDQDSVRDDCGCDWGCAPGSA